MDLRQIGIKSLTFQLKISWITKLSEQTFEPKNAYPFIRYIGGWSPSKSDFLEIIWLLIGRQQFVCLSLLGAV